MDYLFLVSGIVGFGPALFLIWFSMRKYSYPYIEGSAFEDRKVFFLLAVGMVFGTVLVTLDTDARLIPRPEDIIDGFQADLEVLRRRAVEVEQEVAEAARDGQQPAPAKV